MRRLLRRLPVGLLLAALVTCAPQEAPVVSPAPSGASPEIRIGLLVGASRVTVAGDSGLTLLNADGETTARLDPGATWQARLDGPPLLSFVPPPGGLVSLNGHRYRGRLTVVRDRSGFTAINVVRVEDYLPGVVAAEMGRRDSSDAEALAAQAIVSRTYAIRNLGKWASEGFDLLPTVVDMAYGGVDAEYPLARQAVARTAGQVLTWQGVPIDAFFFSTCAGRTANGTEVFAGADRPYLTSISDLDPNGEPYCRLSPRFRWHEEWSAAELRAVLRQSLPGATAVAPGEVDEIRDVEVTRRTASDRVAEISVTLGARSVDVDGPAVRQVLHPVDQTVLRSAIFRLRADRDGQRLTRLIADGAGAGHGVGFCQWGAVGRARQGQDAATILAAYFPGTSLDRAY
ncbi:MAG TPA: SpoIID/LytB domain-containing protein [Gemmatimonadales bacterium]|nr:SpoIID/LytB domain-containing protein [Gemmatimonadales bacterium]